MQETLKQRAIKSMDWMVETMKWRHKETKGLTGVEDVEYSPELTEAIEVLEELKK